MAFGWNTQCSPPIPFLSFRSPVSESGFMFSYKTHCKQAHYLNANGWSHGLLVWCSYWILFLQDGDMHVHLAWGNRKHFPPYPNDPVTREILSQFVVTPATSTNGISLVYCDHCFIESQSMWAAQKIENNYNEYFLNHRLLLRAVEEFGVWKFTSILRLMDLF